MISYICLLATVFANLSCADDMDNSKFDNMIPYGKQEVILVSQSLTRVVNTVMAFCSKGRRSARRLIPFPVPNSVLLP